MRYPSQEIADIIIEAGCYTTSKATRSPIILPDGSTATAYLSLRKLLSVPDARRIIENELYHLIDKSVDLIVGIATAGIPWAHAIATLRNLPLAYVRSSKKGYGIGGFVEGSPKEASRAAVVDDLLCSGNSSKKAIQALKDEKNIPVLQVIGIAALNGAGIRAFQKHGINASVLVNYKEILDSALKKGVINQQEKEKLLKYYQGTGLSTERSL